MMSLASSGRIGRQYFYLTVKILTAESNGQKLQVQGYASDNGKSDTAVPNGFQAASNGTGFDLSSSKSFDQAYSEHGNISQPINLSCSAPSLEGHQANEHEFSPSHQQDILNNSNRVTLNTEINDMTPGVAGGDQSGQQQNSDNHVPLYDSKTYVSLYGVMQSNVPEPYQPPETSNQAETHGHGESHLQMPSGGVVMGDKFMSSHRMDTHATTHITNPKRKFSSSVAHRSAITTHDALEMQVDSPQGIQGEDDVRFKIWLENCSRFGFANCFDHLQGVQSGSKTLHEIFAEQDELIREAAERYRASSSTQDQKLDNPLTKAMLSGEHPYPQGIQGDPDECINLKLWMENCIRYGFTNCDDMLQGVQTGRKTLSQVFEEQEQEIRKVAEHYRNISSSGSGSSGSDPKQVGSSESSPQGGPQGNTPPPEKELSAGAKLKRAVKEYGSTVIVFHVSISLMSLGGFYLAVSSGIDMVSFLQKLGVGQSILESRLATGTGTFVVAYAVHKVFAPVRIATTLTCTPLIVRYLRSKGILKKPVVKG